MVGTGVSVGTLDGKSDPSTVGELVGGIVVSTIS